ncbi:hypothetical protein A3840_03800 [Devosia elaeis]|uniref:Uncharacterized protein n=1 Tax=Devosia elaeis TaxID=1770058 RepID=A0A178I258_9HYPH|nr:hypothetical protein A3840_03800 [Devosia elaeis]
MQGDARIAAFLAQRDLGQQGDPLAVGDEFHDGRERSGREGPSAAVGVQTAGGNGLVAEAMALVQEQDALGRQGRKRDRLCRRLATRRGQHEGIVEERGDRQFRPVQRQFGGDEGDVEAAVPEAVQKGFGAAFADGEAQLRQGIGQRRKDRGQQIGRHGGDQAEAERPPGPAVVAEHESVERLGAADGLSRQGQEVLSERGQLHARLEPVEQGRAAMGLQRQDLLGQGRLRDGASFRRPPEVAGSGHGQGVAHLFEGNAHDNFFLSLAQELSIGLMIVTPL